MRDAPASDDGASPGSFGAQVDRRLESWRAAAQAPLATVLLLLFVVLIAMLALRGDSDQLGFQLFVAATALVVMLLTVAWELRRIARLRNDISAILVAADEERADIRGERENLMEAIVASGDFVWEIDSVRCLSYLSPNFPAITGLDANRLIGRRLEDVTSAENCRPLFEALQRRQAFRNVPLSLTVSTGTSERRDRLFLLSGAADRSGNVRGVARDFDVMVRQHNDDRRKIDQLAIGLDAVSDGVAIFDADERLQFASRKCLEMYGQTESRSGIGLSIEEIVRFRRKARREVVLGHTIEESIQERLRQFRTHQRSEHQLIDGRWIEVVERPIAGGGTLSIHTDITDTKRSQAQLAMVKEQMTDALDAVTLGVVLFNDEDQLVIANRRFAEFFPRFARSLTPGLHFREFVELPVVMGDIDIGKISIEDHISRRLSFHLDNPDKAFRMRLTDGRYVGITERIIGHGGRALIYSDISDLVASESAGRKQEDRFRTLVENLRGIICYRSTGGVTYAYGLDTESLSGIVDREGRVDIPAWQQLVLPEYRDEYLRLERLRRERGEAYVYEYRYRNPATGETRWVRETSWRMIDKDSGEPCFDGYLVDITAQKLEAERRG